MKKKYQAFKKKPSSRKATPPSRQKRVLMLAISVLGILLFYLLTKQPTAITADSELPLPSAQPMTDGEPMVTRPRFEFYTVLSEGTPELTPSTPAPEVQTLQEEKQYLLQVASFKQASDADQLKAELIMLGFDVSTTIFTHQGITWHRIQIGPFHNKADAQDIQHALRLHNLNGLIKEIG